MANIINVPAHWANNTTVPETTNNLWRKWLDYTDTQAKNRTFWFLFSLLAQGVLFLPVPAVLLFYYNAPIIVLVVTMVSFFANVIAGMSGSGIRVLLTLFAGSVIAHLLMLAIFIL